MSAPDIEKDPETGAIPPALLRIILIVSFGPLILNLSTTTINVAIDQLMVRFDAPLSTIHWTITGYLLALTLVLPAFRFVVERVGSRRLYIGCLIAFTITSALAASAWSAQSLIAFRVMQGAVGGLLAPLTQTLVAQIAGPKRMGRAVAIISIPVLVAPLLGPLIGGVLVQRLSWRFLFLFNVPLGVVGAWLAIRSVPSAMSTTRSRLDFRGLLLLSPGIGLFTFALSSIGRAKNITPQTLLPLALSFVLIFAFVIDAKRRPETALIDLRVFGTKSVGAALATILLTHFGSFGAQLLLPLYYQQVRGESAIGAGLLMAPQGLGMLCTLPQIGKLTDRYDNGKIVIVGVLTTLAGTIAFTQASDHSSYVLLSLSLVVRGMGLGATGTPALAAVYKHLAREQIPNATTAINVVQRLGAPIGTATMAMTLQRFVAAGGGLGAPRDVVAHAFAHTFVVSAALAALALVSALALIERAPKPASLRP